MADNGCSDDISMVYCHGLWARQYIIAVSYENSEETQDPPGGNDEEFEKNLY